MSKFFFRLVNDFRMVIYFYMLSLIVISILFSDFETVSLLDSFYWATCTSLTIGYGDISPHTNIMKILTIIFSHFWAFIVIPAVIIKFFKTFMEDRDAFTNEEQETIKQQLASILEKLDKEK